MWLWPHTNRSGGVDLNWENALGIALGASTDVGHPNIHPPATKCACSGYVFARCHRRCCRRRPGTAPPLPKHLSPANLRCRLHATLHPTLPHAGGCASSMWPWVSESRVMFMPIDFCSGVKMVCFCPKHPNFHVMMMRRWIGPLRRLLLTFGCAQALSQTAPSRKAKKSL